MNKTEVTKTVVGTSVGIGSYSIVRSMIKATTYANRGPIAGLLYFMGSVGLAFWVSDLVQSHVERTIDELVVKWTDAKSSTTE